MLSIQIISYNLYDMIGDLSECRIFLGNMSKQPVRRNQQTVIDIVNRFNNIYREFF